MTLHSYWTSKCAECPLKTQCTTGKERRIKRCVNGARNFPNYGEVKFPSLAGGVIRRRFDRGLRFLAAVRDV
jgi:hypothetical protein